MFKRSSIVLLLTIGVVLPACRKDHPIELEAPASDCTPTPSTPMLGWNFQVPEHTVNGPRFNPNDGDEILFIERPFGSQSEYHLHRFRISTGTSVVILSGSNLVNMSYSADWGGNDWILLNLTSATGQNIFKVKANGDSLTQITFTSMNFNPQWSPTCASFGYQYQPGQQFAVKVDYQTGTPDTLQGFFDQSTCWYSEQRATNVTPYGVFDWDMTIGHVTQVCELPSDLYDFGSPTGTAVLPDNQTILWMHTGGLFRTNMTTGSTEQLFLTCNSQYFVGLDYSPQTNKLLTTRVTRTPMNEHDLRIETDIVLMNPDGTDQQVLNLPFPE